MTLQELGEDGLLRRLLPGLASGDKVIAGAGDDCAIVGPSTKGMLLVLKTDCVVEGTHFTRGAAPAAVGWKAMARPLSDFAATSGVPKFALVTLIAPAATKVAWVAALYRGIGKAATRYGVAIVGGETSGTRGPISVSVSIVGEVEQRRWKSRRGGRPGDELFVTGKLGGSLGGRHLKFTPRLDESRWLTEHFDIHAMMDLSDGLGADLPRLARASDVGFEVDETALPLHRGCTIAGALSDGEDYELLFAISAEESAALQRRWAARWRLPLTKIGRLTAHKSAKLPRGYVHFTKRS